MKIIKNPANKLEIGKIYYIEYTEDWYVQKLIRKDNTHYYFEVYLTSYDFSNPPSKINKNFNSYVIVKELTSKDVEEIKDILMVELL